MKLVKMSMVAALLVGSSAFAIENTKVSGDAKVLYGTSDAKGGTTNILAGNSSGSLFDKDSSAADVAVNIGVTTDLVSNDLVKISAGAKYTVLTTLGLENNFVSNVWGGSHSATPLTGASYAGSSHNALPNGTILPGEDALGGAKVENANWMSEAWVAATAGKTTAKLGRMELDTPLAFSEKWSAEVNTFEAVVAINQDLPDTTIVGAYIGNGNGNEGFGQDLASNITTIPASLGVPSLALAGVVNGGGKFGTYGTDGAYALAVVNNSWKPLTVQAWYYDVKNVAQAYWLQADYNCVMVEGLKVGVQYSAHELGSKVADGVKSNVVAAMLGYEVKDVVTVKAAYSQTDKDFAAGFNTATATGDSKLYTKTYWNYGFQSGVTGADTTAMKLSVSSPVNGIVDLGLCYTSVDQSANAGDADLKETALVAKKSFGPLDVKAAFVNVDDKVADDKYNMVLAYLTLNF